MRRNDGAALAATLTAAFWDDPFYAGITAGRPEPERRAALDRYFALALREAWRAGEVQAGDDGAGVAIWTAPSGSPGAEAAASDKQRALQALLRAEEWAAYQAIGAFSHRMVAAAVPDGAWYLSILGVDPARQGAGVGARLLRPTLSRLDAQHLTGYLETFNSRSLAFYGRHGFVTAASAVEPVTGAPYWILCRPPNP